MTPVQAHELKLRVSLFAEKTAMLEYAKKMGPAKLELALDERDDARKELYSFIDELTER